MSKRKHRNRDAQVALLERLGTKGFVPVSSKKDITPAMLKLEKAGAIKRVRHPAMSFFGPHIRYTQFVLAK